MTKHGPGGYSRFGERAVDATTRLVRASTLRAGETVIIDGREHVILCIGREAPFLWLKTTDGRLLPVHEAERVWVVALAED